MAKQRTFLLEFKAQFVLEVLTGAHICQEYRIEDSVLYH